ncbi:MAG: hypothetical protein MK159_02950 [Halobacteriales archaeon]|nr:hypothetical protein [Halobacteriales archaeon]|tara:strand:- start:639 stop:1025 length:387 start_codon:yes stop_codon:yes gene_type:complete
MVEMKRRLFLSKVLIAPVVLVGCMESQGGDEIRSAPTSDRRIKELVRVQDFGINATSEGKLRVDTIVVNEGRAPRVGKLIIVVEVDGAKEQKSEVIEIGPNEKVESNTIFEISFEDFEREGDLKMFIE